MMKKILFLFCILLSSISMFAQHRSEQEAIQIAQNFFKPATNKARLVAVPQKEIQVKLAKVAREERVAAAQNSCCYIINDEANNRFVIISADERMFKVLGYSDNGVFNAETAPNVLLDLIHGYNRQYDLLNKISKPTNGTISLDEGSFTEKLPMITTKWGQSEPFNALCPLDKTYSFDTLCVTGCIATAMAQIINYWEKPDVCSGGIYYYFNPYNLLGLQLLSFNYNNYAINWDNLVDNYNGATDEQKAEVAKLMYACGVSVAMGYSAAGSGSMDYNIPYALKHYFGYNPNIVYRNRDYYTTKEWNSMIMEELYAGRPILYGGFNERHREGHEFIIDGCDENGLLHMNFGQALNISGYLWLGISDGYYQIDAIKPSFLGTEWGDFSYYQSMVCYITPETLGKHEDTFYADYFSLTDLGSSKYFQLNARCYSSDAIDYFATNERFLGTVGIGLFDQDFNFVKSLYTEAVSMKSDSLYTKVLEKVELDVNSLVDNKDYYIAPYALSYGYDIPTRMRALPPDSNKDIDRKAVDSYYKARKSGTNLELEQIIIYVDDSPISEADIPGDANGDGVVDVADIVYIVNYIMEKPAEDFNFVNADVDGDGVIDIADITHVINIIMNANASQIPVFDIGKLTGLELADSGYGESVLIVSSCSRYVASQFDVIVPSGSCISDISLNANILNSHEVIYNKIASNRYRVMVYSTNNNAFDNNSDNLLTIRTNGNTDFYIDNMVCVTSSGMKFGFAGTSSHATDIKTTITDTNKCSIYSIDGREVKKKNLSKGLYILNGKKYIVK